MYLAADHRDLTERERIILRAVVHLYILHAAPVGSRFVSRYLEREHRLSPATIRNTMADLEAMGYITHPHTSAGRMPTDRGYRFYVDSLMAFEDVSHDVAATVVANLMQSPRDHLLRDASRLLGSLSHYLALVRMPELRTVTVQRVEMIRLSSERVLAVLALDSDIVRTVSIETRHEGALANLDDVSRFINERLAGRPLASVADSFPETAEGTADGSSTSTLVRLFVEQAGRLTTSSAATGDGLHVAGTQNLLTHPEFEAPDRMRSVIELVENEDIIVHLLDAHGDGTVRVAIGNELEHDQLLDYSLIATTYRVGTATGTVGLIGPKRMNYGRMVSLVQFVSSVISRSFESPATPS